MDFHPREVVWSKVKGYPWWPAYISKLPEDTDGNYKVIFFAEDTYALLEPKCVQKFSQNYAEHSKTKTKKFLKALQLANNSANRPPCTSSVKNAPVSNKKKSQKRDVEHEQLIDSEQTPQSQESIVNKNEHSESEIMNNQQMEALLQNQIQQVDRKKVEKLENQLTQIINNLQTNRSKQWKYNKYFQEFTCQNQLNSQQLLHSNLTKKIRFIIECMKKSKMDQKQIDKLQNLSTSLKNKVIGYLFDTTYYDQHLKAIDKSKHNKAQVQCQISKIMKRRYNGQIKKQFIGILATQIGIQVGKNSKFKSKQLITDIKEGGYDQAIKSINSKAATQRMADQIIIHYRQ